MGSSASGTSYIKLLDSNGNAVEAQTAYDATMSGPIYASTYTQENPSTPSALTEEAYIPLFLYAVVKNRGTMVSAIFICPTIEGKYFYAGTDPSTLG